MDGRHAQQVREPIDRYPTVTKRRPAQPVAQPAEHHRDGGAPLGPVPTTESVGRPAGRLSRGWAALLSIGWPLTFAIGVAVEPAPANPDAAPLLVEWGGMVMFTGLMVTIGAAAVRSRLAVTAGVMTGLIALAFSASCPLTSHHGFGLWWVAQFGLTAGMLGATLGALRASRPRVSSP